MATVSMSKPSSHTSRTHQLRTQPFLCMPLGWVGYPACKNRYQGGLSHGTSVPFGEALSSCAWQGRVYIDCQLPFGLTSAPAIFSALAEALEWVLRQRRVYAVLHCLDDILFLGAPDTSECTKALTITIATCGELGVPLAQEKIEGPCTSLTF